MTTGGRIVARLIVGFSCALLFASAASPVRAQDASDTGYVHTGVGTQDEARTYPCPRTPAGGWEKTGPVVCLAKRAPGWDLSYQEVSTGCSYNAAGWTGNCIFVVEMPDHIRVWGTRGIQYTKFTISWRQQAVQATAPPPKTSGTSGDAPAPAATVEPRSGRAPRAPAAPAAPAVQTVDEQRLGTYLLQPSRSEPATVREPDMAGSSNTAVAAPPPTRQVRGAPGTAFFVGAGVALIAVGGFGFTLARFALRAH